MKVNSTECEKGETCWWWVEPLWWEGGGEKVSDVRVHVSASWVFV